MVTFSLNEKNIEDERNVTETTLKKVRSVDYLTLLRKHHTSCEPNIPASQFSLRAARESGIRNRHDSCLEMNSTNMSSSDISNKLSSFHLKNSCEIKEKSCTVQSESTTSHSSDNSIVFRFSLPRISLARISLSILAFVVASNHVITTLSPHQQRPRSSLGSAAISSVTQTLSPILPFTGGLDLRRDDYWSTSDNWFRRLQSVAEQLQAAYLRDEIPDSVVSPQKQQLTNLYDHNKTKAQLKSTQVLSLSATQPFASVNEIADLTLGEVGETIRYAMESGQEGFDREEFLNGMQPRLKKVIEAMESAVLLSRGHGKECIFHSDNKRPGDVDALKFAAALRVFGEWRIPRQVPEGYKGFAVGMNLGYKDVVQNLAKIELAVHAWMKFQGHDAPCGPTLRQLLQHEADIGLHAHLPRLKDRTGAMGVLWVRRQLQYQSHIFQNVLLVPEKFSSTEDGVRAAYQEVYGSYHGWAVQKIFGYSFQAAPKSEEIFKQMNPHKLKELMTSSSSSEVVVKSRTVPIDNEGPNTEKNTRIGGECSTRNEGNPFVDAINHIGKEWDKFSAHVENEWGKLVSNVGNNWDNVVSHVERELKLIATNLKLDSNKNPEISIDLNLKGKKFAEKPDDDYIIAEMTKDAREQISIFLTHGNPLLTDLGALFDELNMDDPTKV